MEEPHSATTTDDLPLPPARLFERLAQIPGYTWDLSSEPFHSTYDNWQVYGVRHIAESDTSSSVFASSGRSSSARNSPKFETRPSFRRHWRSSHSESSSELSLRVEPEPAWTPVLARVSSHIVRLEREFHMIRSIIQTSDPECNHTVRPIDLVRLPSQPGDPGHYVVSLFESPGPNYLRELVTFGPAAYGYNIRNGSADSSPGEQVPLSTFLDFAVGACECLELLHHGLRTVHGEIRADTFHFNQETGAVKLINSGSGAKAFDNAFSEGWSLLSREIGVKNKLQFIAPEQTGRMPTEPDSRTDIYTLGVLFWAMIVGKPAFDGNDLVEVVQNVLSKKLPLVTSKRMDIPDAAAAVIQKMTQKQIDERYHTISSVKWDFQQIARLLGDGDINSLKDFSIAQRDVSSFFTLPSTMFGRGEEHDRIVGIIEKVRKRQQASGKPALKSGARGLYTISSNSSTSEGRNESFEHADAYSESGSHGVTASRSNSLIAPHALTHVATRDSSHSTESIPSVQRSVLPTYQVKSPVDTRAPCDPDHESRAPTSVSSHSQLDARGGPGRRKLHPKIFSHSRCEVISISGPPGVGKSDLVQRLQPTIRRHGYIAVYRLDRARRIPFEPVTKVLASLLSQIFSEKDVTSEYHSNIRATLRPLWPMLHQILDLPKHLISQPGQKSSSSSPAPIRAPATSKEEVKWDLLLNDPANQKSSFCSLSQESGAIESRQMSAGNNLRLMDTFVEILGVLTQNKTICVCLDDLQYADEETLELLFNVIKAKIGCVLIVTGRQEEVFPSNVKAFLQNETTNVTRVELGPLTEDDVHEFVAATMHQPPNPSLVPLAAVVLEKCQGNPFYLRMMLETCYRKNCIWYSWRNSTWEYDLDRIFTQFISPSYGQGLGTDFIAKLLQEIPPTARSILLWACLLGSPFQFSMVRKLLSGEFLYDDKDDHVNDFTCRHSGELRQSETDVVAGLQYLLQSYIIVPGKTDDEFRFAHDRYAQAVTSMEECHNQKKMHFIIAQTMMKYNPTDDNTLYSRARHICLAADLIRERVPNRIKYRDVLYLAALTATQSGARPTALWFYRNCLLLLQDNAWDNNANDVYYHETRQLHIETAEMLIFQNQSAESLDLLNVIFKHAKTPACRSRAYILKGRICAQDGDHTGAMDALFTGLEEFDFHLRKPTSWEECDAAYMKLRTYLRQADFEDILARPLSQDRNLIAIGSVMAEAMAVTYWSDALMFCRMAIEMMNIHLFRGAFPQIAVGCVPLAMVALSRFKDLESGTKLTDLAVSLLDLCEDTWTQSRANTIYHLFVSHLRVPIRATIPALESSLDVAYSNGDRFLTLTNLSAMAMSRLYTAQDIAGLETFCTYGPEDITGWDSDLRGGTIILAIRQTARALQGRTYIQSAKGIMSDEFHDSIKYMALIDASTSTGDRPRDIYRGLSLMPLYLYGHYETAMEVGTKIMDSIHGLWSIRVTGLIYFYLSLSILSLHHDDPTREDLESSLETVRKYKAEIDFARSACDSNYGMWSLILEAMIHEVTNEYAEAIQAYEAAIDHSQIHGWPLEEALALELQGDFLSRRGARRAARSIMQDAIAAWRSIGATGKAEHLCEKHEWLLKIASTSRTNDVSCQTVDSLLGRNRDQEIKENVVHPQLEEVRNHHWQHQAEDVPGDRTLDIAGMGLDIIDLSSILEFSQVISSELQIDKLLTKMVEIILESCNGSDFAVIVSEFENADWSIAAYGDPENGAKSFVDGLPISEVEDRMAQQIAHYSLRTKDEVLVHNVLEDERFSNVSETYMEKNPGSRSVIALPIVQGTTLLGVMHIEGKPNSFNQRNLVVLRLLCNQVGISLANAFLFRQVRKVSASNAAMVEAQKRSLAQAREAEQKAKVAEAEARHNVKLKEEAAKAKSIFLANVSHDLRTPMNGVIGLSELLKGTCLDSEQDGYVESIRVCADTLLTLINDILDFSKLEAGKMKVSNVPLNLRETIAEVTRALRYTHRDRGLDMVEDLEGVDPDLLVYGDPVRLHQIFMNLLSNSYKFTPKGSITVRARVAREAGGRIRITCTVHDTGIGIPEEQMSRLFRPFSQADSSTARSYGGSGLGLSICKAIIEEVLGGQIWLESNPGVGTTVTFSLIFNKAPRDAVATSPWTQEIGKNRALSMETKRPANDLKSIPREQIRVCIAEDNPTNMKIAVAFVKNLGLQSEAFSDGDQAVAALRARSAQGNPFHLVLMDVQMPILDGYNATRAIRMDEDPNVRNVLVVAMTASAIEGDREKCLNAGMNNYLAKPVRLEVLKAMLDKYLAPMIHTPKRPGKWRASVSRVDEVPQTNGSKLTERGHPVNGHSEATDKDDPKERLSPAVSPFSLNNTSNNPTEENETQKADVENTTSGNAIHSNPSGGVGA